MSRSHIYIRQLDPTRQIDVLMAERAMEDSGNLFPRGAFRLPTTSIKIADKDGVPILVQPFYVSLVMGSIAKVGNPSEAEVASAMHQMAALAFSECHRMGLLDVLAFSNTEETRAYAKRHNFEDSAHPVLRMEVR